MKNEEHLIQSAYFDILRLHETRYPVLKWIYAVPNGGKRNVIVAAKLKREGVKSGVWDVHIPVMQGTCPGAWIEFKAGRNKLTESQREFEAFILEQGYERAVCYSVEAGIDFTNGYLGTRITI